MKSSPLSQTLRTLTAGLTHTHYQLVVAAADFADSAEWARNGSPTAAHWLAAIADVETCTAREWIRVGRSLRSLHASADAFANGHLSYAKVRALTRFATPDNEDELLELALNTTANHLPRALAAWLNRTSDPAGCTLDDGTPIPDTVIERIAPGAFLRALIHDADARPVNVSHRRRHPTTRQKRLVKERDRACIDCGRDQLLEYDHNPPHEITRRTVTDELELRCASCHRKRHADEAAA